MRHVIFRLAALATGALLWAAPPSLAQVAPLSQDHVLADCVLAPEACADALDAYIGASPLDDAALSQDLGVLAARLDDVEALLEEGGADALSGVTISTRGGPLRASPSRNLRAPSQGRHYEALTRCAAQYQGRDRRRHDLIISFRDRVERHRDRRHRRHGHRPSPR